MLIAIPSKGRAGSVTSHRFLGNAEPLSRLFVPESEVDDYRKYHEQVEGVPDTIRGITPTRNFILDWAKAKNERWVMQVDDDVLSFTYKEGGVSTGFPIPARRKLLLFTNMFVMAEELETNLWGLSVSQDKRFYREYSPFSFLCVVVGNLMGIIDDGQRFDERLVVKEDYDFSLQSLYHHRRILRSNKYAWFVRHHDTPGGCRSYRTRQVEQGAIDILCKKWGSHIIQPNPRKNFEIIVRTPLKGI